MKPKIKIVDRSFDVILAPHGGKDHVGSSSAKSSEWYQTIYLDLDQRQIDGISSDLWHEIMEMINVIHNLKLEHQTITTLGVAIHQVLIDNKEFLEKFKEIVCQLKSSPRSE